MNLPISVTEHVGAFENEFVSSVKYDSSDKLPEDSGSRTVVNSMRSSSLSPCTGDVVVSTVGVVVSTVRVVVSGD